MSKTKEPPKKLTATQWRQTARRIRDKQWEIMESAVANGGEVRICPWDKRRYSYEKGDHYLEALPGEFRFCLIGFMETFSWFDRTHPDWFTVDDAEWDEERATHLYRLTDAGRAALEDRERYDMEPVEGGLVEPGWQAVPLLPEGERCIQYTKPTRHRLAEPCPRRAGHGPGGRYCAQHAKYLPEPVPIPPGLEPVGPPE